MKNLIVYTLVALVMALALTTTASAQSAQPTTNKRTWSKKSYDKAWAKVRLRFERALGRRLSSTDLRAIQLVDRLIRDSATANALSRGSMITAFLTLQRHVGRKLTHRERSAVVRLRRLLHIIRQLEGHHALAVAVALYFGDNAELMQRIDYYLIKPTPMLVELAKQTGGDLALLVVEPELLESRTPPPAYPLDDYDHITYVKVVCIAALEAEYSGDAGWSAFWDGQSPQGPGGFDQYWTIENLSAENLEAFEADAERASAHLLASLPTGSRAVDYAIEKLANRVRQPD